MSSVVWHINVAAFAVSPTALDKYELLGDKVLYMYVLNISLALFPEESCYFHSVNGITCSDSLGIILTTSRKLAIDTVCANSVLAGTAEQLGVPVPDNDYTVKGAADIMEAIIGQESNARTDAEMLDWLKHVFAPLVQCVHDHCYKCVIMFAFF